MAMSQQQAPSQQTTSNQESPQTDSPSTDAVGNQQRNQEAGLSGAGAAPEEMGILGPFAEMILDAMPLSGALLMAKGAMDNPTVQKWVGGLDIYAAVKELGRLSNTLLKDIWPVGLGIDFEGEVAGVGNTHDVEAEVCPLLGREDG